MSFLANSAQGARGFANFLKSIRVEKENEARVYFGRLPQRESAPGERVAARRCHAYFLLGLLLLGVGSVWRNGGSFW